jgi:hypothetical protein
MRTVYLNYSEFENTAIWDSQGKPKENWPLKMLQIFSDYIVKV